MSGNGQWVAEVFGEARIVATCEGSLGKYGVTADGELWKIAGRASFRCGHVMNPENIEDIASWVDTYEEEMRVMIAEARREFS